MVKRFVIYCKAHIQCLNKIWCILFKTVETIVKPLFIKKFFTVGCEIFMEKAFLENFILAFFEKFYALRDNAVVLYKKVYKAFSVFYFLLYMQNKHWNSNPVVILHF